MKRRVGLNRPRPRFWSVVACHRFPTRNQSRAATGRSIPKNMQLNIVVLPGDGVGPEVTEQAVHVLREVANIHGHTFHFTEHDAGGVAIRRWGAPLPRATL